MRQTGAAAIMLASIAIGVLSLRSRRRRLRCLRQLRDALELMAGELSGKHTPLPELIQSVQIHTAGEVRDFFSSLSDAFDRLGETPFCDLWQENAVICMPLLTDKERDELALLGKQLGRTDLSRQLAALDSCIRYLSAELDREESLFQRDRKLCLGLPSAFGAMLLALLL